VSAQQGLQLRLRDSGARDKRYSGEQKVRGEGHRRDLRLQELSNKVSEPIGLRCNVIHMAKTCMEYQDDLKNAPIHDKNAAKDKKALEVKYQTTTIFV
jgi:hypothetical protein